MSRLIRTLRRTGGTSSGLSLIQLMILIALIGILIDIGALQINYALRKSRDTARRDALRSLETALAAYHGDHNAYPDVSGGAGVGTTASELLAPGFRADWIPNLAPKYINQLPTDPAGEFSSYCAPGSPRTYYYKSDVGGKNYKLIAYCSSETNEYNSSEDPLIDPQRPTWAWQVTNNAGLTNTW